MKKIDEEKVRKKVDKNIKRAKEEVGAFKKFISKGNVVDMAVGVIIGGGFSKIVSSLVNDVILPAIGIVSGGLDFSNLAFEHNGARIAYGAFLQTVIDFLIVAICIFTVIRIFEKFKSKEKKEETISPTKSSEVLLLEEIRDLLKEKNEKQSVDTKTL